MVANEAVRSSSYPSSHFNTFSLKLVKVASLRIFATSPRARRLRICCFDVLLLTLHTPQSFLFGQTHWIMENTNDDGPGHTAGNGLTFPLSEHSFAELPDHCSSIVFAPDEIDDLALFPGMPPLHTYFGLYMAEAGAYKNDEPQSRVVERTESVTHAPEYGAYSPQRDYTWEEGAEAIEDFDWSTPQYEYSDDHRESGACTPLASVQSSLPPSTRGALGTTALELETRGSQVHNIPLKPEGADENATLSQNETSKKTTVYKLRSSEASIPASRAAELQSIPATGSGIADSADNGLVQLDTFEVHENHRERGTDVDSAMQDDDSRHDSEGLIPALALESSYTIPLRDLRDTDHAVIGKDTRFSPVLTDVEDMYGSIQNDDSLNGGDASQMLAAEASGYIRDTNPFLQDESPPTDMSCSVSEDTYVSEKPLASPTPCSEFQSDPLPTPIFPNENRPNHADGLQWEAQLHLAAAEKTPDSLSDLSPPGYLEPSAPDQNHAFPFSLEPEQSLADFGSAPPLSEVARAVPGSETDSKGRVDTFQDFIEQDIAAHSEDDKFQKYDGTAESHMQEIAPPENTNQPLVRSDEAREVHSLDLSSNRPMSTGAPDFPKLQDLEESSSVLGGAPAAKRLKVGVATRADAVERGQPLEVGAEVEITSIQSPKTPILSEEALELQEHAARTVIDTTEEALQNSLPLQAVSEKMVTDSHHPSAQGGKAAGEISDQNDFGENRVASEHDTSHVDAAEERFDTPVPDNNLDMREHLTDVRPSPASFNNSPRPSRNTVSSRELESLGSNLAPGMHLGLHMYTKTAPPRIRNPVENPNSTLR